MTMREGETGFVRTAAAWKRLVHNWRLFRAARAVSKAGALLKKDGSYMLAYQAYVLSAKIGQEE